MIDTDGKRKRPYKKKRKGQPGAVNISSSEESEDEQDRAVKILTGLLTKKGGDESSLAKKPVKSFTDADFDRETKELNVKKLRLEVKLMEEQNRLCYKIGRGIDKFMKALDVYIEDKSSHARVVYTNADGTSILQTAYDESVAGDSHVQQ